MNVAIAIFGLALLIFVHEAGHFFASIAVGMSPRKFYIGFPPALFKTKRKGIEYGIGAVPLGGYVKIPGMHRPAASDVDAHFAPARSERPELTIPIERLRRALDDDDLVAARAELSALEDALTTTELSSTAAHSAGRGVRELEDALGADAYWRQAAWKRITAIAAGPVTNIIFALILFTALFLVSGGAATSKIETVRSDFPAAAAGLKPGDEILAIGDRQVAPDTIGSTINNSKGKKVKIIVARGDTLVELGPVQAKKDSQSGRYLIGIVLNREGLSVPGAAWNSIRLSGLVTKQIGVSLSQLVTGKNHEDISSPVGIVKGSSTALNEGTENYLWVLGLLSLSLALLNLLPLLPLDGGHILFSAIEGIRGRAVGRRVYERVSAVGLAVVLLLFFVGLTNDIGNLGS